MLISFISILKDKSEAARDERQSHSDRDKNDSIFSVIAVHVLSNFVRLSQIYIPNSILSTHTKCRLFVSNRCFFLFDFVWTHTHTHTQNRSLSKAWVLGSCFSLFYILFNLYVPCHLIYYVIQNRIFFVSFWISLAFDSVQFGRSVDLLHIGNRNTQKLLWDISIYLFFSLLLLLHRLRPLWMRIFFSQSFHFHYTIRTNCRITRKISSRRKRSKNKRRSVQLRHSRCV